MRGVWSMRSWVEKLRWGLLAGGVLLLLLLGGVLGYSRYKALRTWHRILQRSGATLTRETNGFTYSQSVGGRTVFTLHAAKAVQAKDGKYALHDVSLLLYRQADGRADRLYGSDFEYDEKTGVARALGPVHMDLQAPEAMGRGSVKAGKKEPAGADRENGQDTIHVKTSGMVYVRNLGVAATDQDVEFRFGGMECHARGAEFNSEQGTIHLLADVQMSGEVRGRDLHLTAARVDLDRGANLATLKSPKVRSEGETASAEGAVLHLRHDGLLERAEAAGAVRVTRGAQVLTADRAEARLSEEAVLQDLRASGDVSLADETSARPLHARAANAHASFGPHGVAREIEADGAASMEFYDRSHGGTGLRRQAGGDRMVASFGAADAKGKPVLRWVKIEGHARAFGESYAQAETGKRSGSGGGAGFVVAPGSGARQIAGPQQNMAESDGKGSTTVVAQVLLITVAPGTDGKPQAQTVQGTGDTMLEQNLSAGASRRSTGDRLLLRLGSGASGESGVSGASSAAGVVSALQEGHVTLRNAAVTGPAKVAKQAFTEAVAERAEYRAAEHRLQLTGRTRLHTDDGELTASRVDLDTLTGGVEAQGQVLATLEPRDATVAAPLAGSEQATGAGTPKGEATHVSAASARFVRDTDVAEFHGSDAEPVRLWQGGSQIQAATILLDRKHGTLAARPSSAAGVVRTVLISEANEAAPGAGKEAPKTAGKQTSTDAGGALRVTSAQLNYTEATHEATFGGGVRATGLMGEVRSRNAVVFVRDPKADATGAKRARSVGAVPAQATSTEMLGGSVDRIVLSGQVQLQQPGRTGTGDQLLYTAADASFVLTGSPGRPPHIVDAQQGSITGATLLFRTGDNTVVVASDPARAGTTRGRVRTELDLRP